MPSLSGVKACLSVRIFNAIDLHQTKRARVKFLQVLLLIFCLAGVACTQSRRGLFVMRWVEKPVYTEDMKDVPEEKRLHFDKVGGYTEEDEGFSDVMQELREGDVIAYRMTPKESGGDILKGRVNSVGYSVLDYGHLAILTYVDGNETLKLLSSQAFKGPNTKEDVHTLKDHSFDVYRLNRWDKVDLDRFHDFVQKSQEKAGNWIGYDFSGMFGVWNSNLRPSEAKAIGHDYICSTIVAAALYYAGADMKVSGRAGWLDLVSPRQVVMSHGYLRELKTKEQEK